MEIRSRTIGKLAAGVVLLMAATLAADVAVHSNGINVLGNASSMPGNALVRAELSNYSASSAAVYGYAPTTGTAVYGRGTGGVGVSAMSTSSYGVWGRSTNSWGGYFKSTNGYGLVVETDGTEIFDFGVKVSSNWGHGIFVTSLHNQGVRAEVGDLSAGKSMPGGAWGTVAIGESGGAWGSSWNNWGVYGNSYNYRGVQGNTDRVDRNYGLHTYDNIYSLNYHLTGSMMQLVQNVGDVTLELGEVVELRGVRRSVSEEDAKAAGLPAELAQIPIVQVGRVSLSSDPAVAGVVYSRYNIAAFEEAPTITRVIGGGVDPVSLSESKAEWESVDPTPPGPVQPGELLLVVVQGPVEVRAVELGAAIEPGSPLAISSIEGYATVAERSGGKSAESSAAFARALERLEPGRDTVFAYIALH